MNKKVLVASLGTLTLVVNLMLPSLSSAQLTDTQGAEQEIGCQTGVDATFAITTTPEDVVFTDLVAGATAQSTFDASTAADTALPVDHAIIITDSRSGNNENCPDTLKGFTVNADITTSMTGTTYTLSDGNFRIITSNEFVPGLDWICADGEDVCYGSAETTVAPFGNIFDVVASQLYDDPDKEQDVHWNEFRTADIYTEQVAVGGTEDNPNGAARTNTLDNPVLLMESHTSHESTIGTGVVLYGNIPTAEQKDDLYTGVITYTLASQN